MTFDAVTWLSLPLRWLHLIAGVAWIGASFYFIWLDNNLVEPATPREGVKGELWAVHGGGFYHSQKYLSAPPQLPDHLHWFKWEAYTTWISGFLLLSVLYYWEAPVYLIDPSKAPLTHAQAILTGLGFIFGGVAVYEALCRSPLGARPRLFGIAWFLILTAAAYGLTRLFSDRGAFIHVGAIIGTVMASNVFLVIIPNQTRIVEAMRAGEAVDPRLGAMGKQRSVHNNYMTLPVLFIMISNHYPAVTGHPLSWLLLAMLSAAGVSIRHFFNLKHTRVIRHDFLFYGFVLVFITCAIATTPPARLTLVRGPVAFATVDALVHKHCIMCHSSSPTHRGVFAPPNGVAFDTPQRITQFAPKMYERAVASTSMPLGNETGMTDLERAQLGTWIKEGGKTQ